MADIPAPWDYAFAAAALVLLGAAAVGFMFMRRLVKSVEFMRGLLDELAVLAGDREAQRQEWESDLR